MYLNARVDVNCERKDGRTDGRKTGRLYRTLLKQVRQKIKIFVLHLRLKANYRGDGTNSFPIDLNTYNLENTTPFLRIAATLVYRSFELVNSKFK